MATRTVTTTVIRPNGSPWKGGKITARLADDTYTISPAAHYPTATVVATTDTNGAATLTLASGLSSYYVITLPDQETFSIYVPAGSSTTLEQLRSDFAGYTPTAPPFSGGTPGGSSGQVQVNISGSFAGDDGLTYDPATNTLTVGTVAATAVTLSGALTLGTALTAGNTAKLGATGTAGSTTFLRGDGAWAVPAGGGGGGTGDVVGPASAVDSEVALFSGAGGKTIKRATGSGLALLTSGVLSVVTAPSGAIVGTTDTQTLSGKTLTTPTVTDLSNMGHDHTGAAGGGTLSATAIASGTLATARLGSGTPSTTTFLRGDSTWAVPAGGGGGGGGTLVAWTPFDLGTTTLRGWFKADAITGLTNGTAVSSWTDSSGNARHATQATGATQPIYRTGLQNSLPGVDFVSADALTTTVTASSLDETILAVIDLDTINDHRTLVGGATGGRHIRLTSGARQIQYLKQGTASIAISTAVMALDTPTILHGTLGTTTGSFSFNGSLSPDTFTHAQTLTAGISTAIGAPTATSPTTEVFDGVIYEILICATLSQADRQRAEGYLAHKWGLTANLPSTHPYKSIPPGTATPIDILTLTYPLSPATTAKLAESGTASSTSFLRGDGTWAVPTSTPLTDTVEDYVNAIGGTYVWRADFAAKGSLLIGTAYQQYGILPVGTNGQVLTADSGQFTGVKWATGGGDVVGPASATDTAIARFSGTTGKLVQNSATTLDGAGLLTLPVAGIVQWSTRARISSPTDGAVMITNQAGTGGGRLSLGPATAPYAIVNATGTAGGVEILTGDLANYGTLRAAKLLGIVVEDGGSAVAGSWSKITQGTLLTTPESGAREYDGKAHYLTYATGGRAPVQAPHEAITASDFTLTAASGVQSAFPAAQDVLSLQANTAYKFEAFYYMTTGATTHTTAIAFALSSATGATITYEAETISAASVTAQTGAWTKSIVAAFASTVINATSTAANTWVRLRGTIRTNAATTITPQINFSANPGGTNVMKQDSFFRAWPIGSNTVAAIGAWA